ncbi:MAG TPA: hypothetical protein VMV18_06710, partial [bacterium]|nr:hypothetical protein [bacterium]
MRSKILAFSLVLGALAAGSGACGYMPADAATPDGNPDSPGNPTGSVTPTGDATSATSSTETPTPLPAVDPSTWTLTKLSTPSRTEVHGPDGAWLATLTNNAYTVTLRGPARSIAEPTAAAPVQSTTWVRILPAPFSGTIDDTVKSWLTAELSDTTPDILQLGLQYIDGAPPQTDQSGLQFAGDADYGPLQSDGTRQEGS